MSGPLDDITVVELAGIGPGPFCGMVLSDLGADVIRVDRASSVTGQHDPTTRFDILNRGRRSIGVDLKNPDGVDVVLRLAERADALIEGFRPGVTERLGVGPDVCLERNPRLVYGRMTGWGQDGPLATTAGHDIDYIAVAGALHPVGPADRPVPPLNLVGDFGGGAMLLAVGVLAGVLQARSTGRGQVVDAAMVDGAALLTAMMHGAMAAGWWQSRRQSNLLDGGAPFYRTYRTSDGRHVAVGALEPQFYAELVERLGLDPEGLPDQMDRERWPELAATFETTFASKTRDEWTEILEGTDACVVPVMALDEAPEHPHLVARGTFVDVAGLVQPGPAPRFSATPGEIVAGPVVPGDDTDSILSWLGCDDEETDRLRRVGAVR